MGFKPLSASNTADVFSKMLKIQLLTTIVVAIIAMLASGFNAGVSALLGGLTVVLGTSAAGFVVKRGATKQEAASVLVNLLKAEAVKILVIVAVLAIIFNVYKQLVPYALIAGLAVALLFSASALSKLKA